VGVACKGWCSAGWCGAHAVPEGSAETGVERVCEGVALPKSAAVNCQQRDMYVHMNVYTLDMFVLRLTHGHIVCFTTWNLCQVPDTTLHVYPGIRYLYQASVSSIKYQVSNHEKWKVESEKRRKSKLTKMIFV
jgi:hypothetical protein